MMAESSVNSEVPAAKRRRPNRSVYCSHCKQRVPTSTYYRHWEQFYDVVSQQWHTATETNQTRPTEESTDEEVSELQTSSQGRATLQPDLEGRYTKGRCGFS